MLFHQYLRKSGVVLLFVMAILSVGSAACSAQETPNGDTDTASAIEATAEGGSATEEAAKLGGWKKWEKEINDFFGVLVGGLATVLFFDFWTEQWLGTSVPFVVVWLIVGATFLTLRMGFVNIRCFGHAIRVTKGDYDDPDDKGEVSHFQALTSALSATVGLGNIAGVAIAVGTGGPGAVFWMILAGLLGMTSKFTECTLGQMYRRVDPSGHVSGGPMRYIKDGLTEMGLGPLGIVLAGIFAILCIGGSVGGGCAFQVSQSMDVVKLQIPWLADNGWAYGLLMVVMVGIVIIGGIRRIAATAEKIVPLMCAIYVTTALVILGMNVSAIPAAFATIFQEAFSWDSAYGGLLGVMVIGIKRAVFSNEAGIGSAAIAHSAARTKYPVREGIVALLEPFVDTVVICTMTGLVIVITGAYDVERFPEHAALIAADQGALLTSNAFESAVWWFPRVLAMASVLFAYSTMISWSYYGERCFTFLFGSRSSMIYRLFFLLFVFLGAVVSAKNVNVFSELMILSMALPNMLVLFILSGKVKRAFDEYWSAKNRGEFAKD